VGAKTWMLVYSDADAREALKSKPELDREATQRLVRALFPNETLEPLQDGDLSYTCPPDKEIHAGCLGRVSVVAANEFAIDHPSKLPRPFIDAGGGGTVHLHAMHSVVDWFAYAKWTNGQLVRCLSLSPDSGILEDIGDRLAFEEPYWSGEHSEDGEAEDESGPFPFHPLDLGEAALREFFGYQLEGLVDSTLLEPESIPLMRFRRKRPWWKRWR
jgi:hypothetical protein